MDKDISHIWWLTIGTRLHSFRSSGPSPSMMSLRTFVLRPVFGIRFTLISIIMWCFSSIPRRMNLQWFRWSPLICIILVSFHSRNSNSLSVICALWSSLLCSASASPGTMRWFVSFMLLITSTTQTKPCIGLLKVCTTRLITSPSLVFLVWAAKIIKLLRFQICNLLLPHSTNTCT